MVLVWVKLIVVLFLLKLKMRIIFLLFLYLISMRNLIQLEKIYSFVLKKY